jgi:hypothetical protein
VLPNRALAHLDRTKKLTGDVLFTYMVSPGTAIYVGYTERRENLALDALSNLRRTTGPGQLTGRQFFAKVSYLFRF